MVLGTFALGIVVLAVLYNSADFVWLYWERVRDFLQDQYTSHGNWMLATYMGIYILVGMLCLPGTGFLNLTGASLFGPLTGLLAICLSRALGGLLACGAVRYLFRDKVQQRFGRQLEPVNKGFAREGGFYLFALRLIPGLPFPVTNMLMGLTPISLASFFWITFVASVPGSLVTINAAQRIKTLSSPGDVFSPAVVLSLALIGVLPILLKKAVHLLRKTRERPQAD